MFTKRLNIASFKNTNTLWHVLFVGGCCQTCKYLYWGKSLQHSCKIACNQGCSWYLHSIWLASFKRGTVWQQGDMWLCHHCRLLVCVQDIIVQCFPAVLIAMMQSSTRLLSKQEYILAFIHVHKWLVDQKLVEHAATSALEKSLWSICMRPYAMHMVGFSSSLVVYIKMFWHIYDTKPVEMIAMLPRSLNFDAVLLLVTIHCRFVSCDTCRYIYIRRSFYPQTTSCDDADVQERGDLVNLWHVRQVHRLFCSTKCSTSDTSAKHGDNPGCMMGD